MKSEKFKKYLDEDYVLIYQMGKVGSSSLENSINKSIHVHSLYGFPPNQVHSKMLYSTLFKNLQRKAHDLIKRIGLSKRKKIKIITIVRNPGVRNVSMFFQSLPFWLAEYQSGFLSGKALGYAREEGREVLFDCFDKIFPHSYPDDWFDKELGRLTGIDFFNQGFDKDKGASIYQNGKYEVLLLTLDKISDNLNVISKFCNEDVVLQNSNQGENKWYSGLYKEFKAEVDRTSYQDKLKSSKVYKAFF